jgi:hypothetical protein
MLKYSLIDDGRASYRHGYETHEEQEKIPEPDQKSTLRARLREVEQMTLDELKAKITAILPGATFEIDSLGRIVIRASCRLHIDPETLAETLREKARDFVPPPKKGLFGKRK